MERKIKAIDKSETPFLAALLGIEAEETEYLITISDVPIIEAKLQELAEKSISLEKVTTIATDQKSDIDALSDLLNGTEKEKQHISDKLTESEVKVAELNKQLACFLEDNKQIHELPSADKYPENNNKQKLSSKERAKHIKFQN